jgi:hypothetical protein
MIGLADPFGFAEIGYILFPEGRGRVCDAHGQARRPVSREWVDTAMWSLLPGEVL